MSTIDRLVTVAKKRDGGVVPGRSGDTAATRVAAPRRTESGAQEATTPVLFPPLEGRVLRQSVHAALRLAILDGRVKPGDRILEADVAAQMAVSRAPVREAVRQLEQEGLVAVFPHRGATVVGVPDEEIEAIYEMRAVIEAKAIRRACGQVTDGDLAAMSDLVAEIGQAAKVDDIDALAEADLRFHASILQASGYRLLRHMWEGMDGLVRVRSYQAFAHGSAGRYFRQTSVSSHTVILDALRARDPEAAARAVREHILEVADRIRAERGAAQRAAARTRTKDTKEGARGAHGAR